MADWEGHILPLAPAPRNESIIARLNNFPMIMEAAYKGTSVYEVERLLKVPGVSFRVVYSERTVGRDTKRK